MVFLAAPSRVAREDGKVRLECLRMQLGRVDASGRRRPEPISGSEFVIEADTVVAAIGQSPEVPASLGLATERGGTLRVDRDTLVTERPGVFAGGDVVSGPASVIEAVAAGRQVAISIDRYLGGSGVIEERLVAPEETMPETGVEEGEKRRIPIPLLPVNRRLPGSAEVELGYSEGMAMEEAQRCLRCDLEE